MLKADFQILRRVYSVVPTPHYSWYVLGAYTQTPMFGAGSEIAVFVADLQDTRCFRGQLSGYEVYFGPIYRLQCIGMQTVRRVLGLLSVLGVFLETVFRVRDVLGADF